LLLLGLLAVNLELSELAFIAVIKLAAAVVVLEPI